MSRRLPVFVGLLTSIALAALAAQPALAGPLPSSTPPQPSVPVLHMGSYDPSRYSARAAELEPALLQALARDVHMTGAQYLAQADAALRATEVVASLKKSGVTVRGFHLDGTALVVNVASSSDAALVAKTGATADLSKPHTLAITGPKTLATSNIDVHGGQGYWWQDADFDYVCSVGFNGFVVSSGVGQFATAGHCLDGSDAIVGRINAVTQSVPGSGTLSSTTIGDPVASSIQFGSGYDVSRVGLASGTTAKPDVVTWGGGSGAPLSGSPRNVTGEMPGVLNATLCRSGATTGWRCGPIVDVDYLADNFDGAPGLTINSIVARLCTEPGDSGGAGVVGTSAVGLTSWSDAGATCSTDNSDYTGLFPMSSSSPSVDTAYGSTWEIQAAVPAPGVTKPASINPNTVTGTLASATAANSVSLFLDGSSTAFASAPVTISGGSTTGTWSLDISAAPNGLHTFTVVANYGTWSHSAPVAGSFARNVTVNRLSGADRYATGLQVAAAGFTAPVPVLYLTTGMNYPDALSAGPAAAHLGGPLLLVQPQSVSQNVLDAIAGFQPTRIIVLGAENSVSALAFSQIQAAVPTATIARIQGASRFETSRLITRDAFLDSDTDGVGAATAYVSNGNNFPDALSAGGAAASVHGPVILVNGQASSVPPETIQLLTDLGVTKVVVTGAQNSVSTGIFNQLAALPGVTAVRQTGADRYATSAAVNNAAFDPTQTQVLLATGQNYPDALAGSSLAGRLGDPLYITTQACIQPATFNELVRLKATAVTLLGGTPSLSAAVQALQEC